MITKDHSDIGIIIYFCNGKWIVKLDDCRWEFVTIENAREFAKSLSTL